jgi:hypothetical protein
MTSVLYHSGVQSSCAALTTSAAQTTPGYSSSSLATTSFYLTSTTTPSPGGGATTTSGGTTSSTSTPSPGSGGATTTPVQLGDCRMQGSIFQATPYPCALNKFFISISANLSFYSGMSLNVSGLCGVLTPNDAAININGMCS